MASSDSLRPTLDTSAYYASASHVAHHQSFAPHGYYAPMPPQPPHYAMASSLSMKRKSPGASSSATSSSSAAASPASLGYSYTQDKLCDLCYHPDPVLFSAVCGHLFHSRCVHVWPLEQCPVCDAAMPYVNIIRIDMNAQIDTRSGKWTRPEEKFIDCILAEFDRSSLPLANGTPVRLVLAKLLNCSTMRLSKKFQKNALGKRTFRIAKPLKGEAAIAFDAHDHVARQKEFSRLEAIFRHELVEQFRRENNTDDGAHVETHDLRHAVKQFWVACFVKLAVVIGQPVCGLDVSDAKKKKRALVLIRNGQYDDLLAWNASPANTPTISPLPHRSGSDPGALAAAAASVTTPWHSSGYSAHAQPLDHLQSQQPVKKMRTPESMRHSTSTSCDVDVAHFEIQPAPPMAVATAYEYGKTSPRGFSPASATDPHHHHPYYAHSQSVGYARGYATTYPVKTEKPELPHYGQQQLGAAMSAPSYSSSSSSDAYRSVGQLPVGPAAGSYESSSESSGASHQHQQQQTQQQQQQQTQQQQTYPWDELLEGIAEPNPQVVDPALQAWSNLHIM